MWDVSIALALACVTLWILYRRRLFSVFKQLGIPGPEPSILFGNIWELSSRNPLVCHKEWLDKYGNVVGYYLGTSPVILISDTDVLKKIQISDFQKFINRPGIFNAGRRKPRPGDGFTAQLTTLRDKRWKEIRSTLTPSFTTSKMKQMSPTINNAIDSLIKNVDEKVEEGKSFDIYKFYQGLTMDVIGRTAFGIQTDCQRNPNDPFLRSARVLFSGELSSIFAVLGFSFPEFGLLFRFIANIRLRFKNRGRSPLKMMLRSVKDVIKARRENPSNRRQDLLQIMIDAQISDSNKSTGTALTAGEEEANEKQTAEVTNAATTKSKPSRHMVDDEILDNAVLFFLAGYETTSTALAFTTHFLIHYPEVQERVRKEVQAIHEKEGKLDYASVQQLQYLDQVLTESLRMYPPINLFVTREISEDMEIGSLRLKKGLAVQVPTYTMQHDEIYWEEPEKFNPERFSPENKSRNNPLAFQAFGAGPRNCVGMRFAQMEAKLAIARLLIKYRLEKAPESAGLDIPLKISAATITPLKGIHLKAVPL